MKKWIQKAVKKPGSLRKALGVKEGEKIPEKKLSAAAKKSGKMGQRARLAETLKTFGKGKRMAAGGPAGYGGTKTNEPAGRGGVGGTGLGGVSGGIRGGGSGRGGPAGGVTTGTTTGVSATNRPAPRPMPGRPAATAPAVRPPKMDRPKRPSTPAKMPEVEEYTPPEVPDEVLPAPPRRDVEYRYNNRLAPGAYPGMFTRNPTSGPQGGGRYLRGGGLARKGVGQALSHGGKVKPSKKR